MLKALFDIYSKIFKSLSIDSDLSSQIEQLQKPIGI